MLANTLPYLAEGVHLAVVDPGVRAIGVRSPFAAATAASTSAPTAALVPAAEKLGRIDAAHEITNREYALQPVSATFHGQDIFSPAAAHLALGLEPAELGPAIDRLR